MWPSVSIVCLEHVTISPGVYSSEWQHAPPVCLQCPVFSLSGRVSPSSAGNSPGPTWACFMGILSQENGGLAVTQLPITGSCLGVAVISSRVCTFRRGKKILFPEVQISKGRMWPPWSKRAGEAQLPQIQTQTNTLQFTQGRRLQLCQEPENKPGPFRREQCLWGSTPGCQSPRTARVLQVQAAYSPQKTRFSEAGNKGPQWCREIKLLILDIKIEKEQNCLTPQKTMSELCFLSQPPAFPFGFRVLSH